MENEIVMQWWVLRRNDEVMVISCPSDNDPLHGYGSWDLAKGPFETQEEAYVFVAASTMGRKGGKIGGQSKSPTKQASSRENGKKGGRPRKDKAE